ncbi:D-amino acid dehydrogenase [Maricaulis sp.]|uniref:D-amino acid dehydrogenase n=1 Tax=Maricaulis sp. TaxID=1486257 RepID=UPI0025BB86FE|nr:D-amino acid dehydrogenase [Maricaulis sp.]
MAKQDVIIIGAGLAGVAAAHALRERGHDVLVLDTHPGAGLETSFANAGALTPSEPEPWNAPGVHWKLLASLADPHSAMKLRLHALPGLIPWGLQFLANSTRKRHEAAALANFALSRYSLGRTQAARDQHKLEFANLANGTMKVCRDARALEPARQASQALADAGLRWEILDRAAMVKREPLLADVADQMAGAVFYPDDESGDAHRFTQALAAIAAGMGVRFEYGSTVDSLIDRAGRIIGIRTATEEIEADQVVIATGHASRRLLAPLGLHIPVRPVKGYSLSLDMSGLNDRPALPVVDDALHAIVTPLGDRLRVAGTAEFAGEDRRLRAERVENLRLLLRRVYPALAERLLTGDEKPWCGFRPMSADGRPVIGETRAKGLWITTGHGHLGWTQAMGSAGLLAALMDGETPPVPAEAFSAKRF